MRKILIFIFAIFLLNAPVNALETGSVSINESVQNSSNVKIFSEKNKFGLKDKEDNIIIKPQYSKLIPIGQSSYICLKRNRYGLINSKGEILIKPRFRHADRYFGRFAKLGNYNDFGIYDEYGKAIVPPQYSEIDPLYGKMFLTCKNFQYGITSFEGKVLLENEYDNIYMPSRNIMRIEYQGQWFEVERLSGDDIVIPENAKKVTMNTKDYKVTTLVSDAGLISSYSVVSATNYLLKILSSISPAYEQTIDDLMFSQGAEGVNVFIKMTWLPRFPITYAVKYYSNLKAPNNGPLAGVKKDIKRQMD